MIVVAVFFTIVAKGQEDTHLSERDWKFNT